MKMYILEGKTIKEVDNIQEWGVWFEKSDRHVKKTNITEDIMISTVFLGMDHSFGIGGPPLLFETMIFGGPHDEYQERYATWDEAEKGHLNAIEMCNGVNATK